MRRLALEPTLLLLAVSCTGHGPDAERPLGPSFAPSGGSPSISSADPGWTTQDTTLDVRVLGSGFDKGSVAEWAIGGVTDPDQVRTNSTRYVSSRELVANITVSATAPLAYYDIIVRTIGGKRGIGAEKFQVVPKGGGRSSSIPIGLTLNSGVDLASDGKGPYQDGICGVGAGWIQGGQLDGHLSMRPTGNPIPDSQVATCTGIAPRSAVIRLAIKHLSDSPHLDDTMPSGGGTFNLTDIKFGLSGPVIINGPTGCYRVSKSGKVGGAGLRFDPASYPGSSAVQRQDLGGGAWRLYTAPYPNNLAYCDDNSASRWHVSIDFEVQVLTP